MLAIRFDPGSRAQGSGALMRVPLRAVATQLGAVYLISEGDAREARALLDAAGLRYHYKEATAFRHSQLDDPHGWQVSSVPNQVPAGAPAGGD